MSSSSSPPTLWASVRSTFGASVRSVGTAVTLVAVGFYLHRRGSVGGEGKRTLALISQQVTVPLFLFTRILYCNQDWSDAPCPDVTRSLGDVWMLLYWPAVVVALGLLVGNCVVRLCNVPSDRIRLVLAASAFGNSTGLPITLLAVVHANFPSTSDLGHMDPTLFLSVYLLLYPVLQWGVGGWLLAPPEDEEATAVARPKLAENAYCAPLTLPTPPARPPLLPPPPGMPLRTYSAPPPSSSYLLPSSPSASTTTWGGRLRHNVLNNRALDDAYLSHRHGLASSDESLYLSEVDLVGLAPPDDDDDKEAMDGAAKRIDHAPIRDPETSPLVPKENSSASSTSTKYQSTSKATFTANEYLIPLQDLERRPPPQDPPRSPALSAASSSPSPPSSHPFDAETLGQAARTVAARCLQPPVVGGLLGLAVASWPAARGVLVDLEHRRSRAPLQWCFDALYSVGQAAVPLNMMILGANLSSAATSLAAVVAVPWKGGRDRRKSSTTGGGATTFKPKPLFDARTLVGIVAGKMVVLPILGITLGWILKTYVWNIPDDIDGAFYLVLMIVFLCPTANNVMVMVELSGSEAKEGLAQVIALQYLVAPFILSVTMTVAVGVASGWS